MPFHPNVNETLTIEQVLYRFTEHPAAKGVPYGQTGRRATVYQTRDGDGSLRALKVFTQAFRTPRNANGADRLRPFAQLPGLQVCARTVLTSERHGALLAQFPDLAYAVLMPWISGETWQEIVAGARPLAPEQSLLLAQAFARVLSAMEQAGLAHCDLSGPNVIVGLSPINATMVDVEDMFGPGLVRPEKLPGGSPGYAHRTAPQGLWSAEADRFGGAILLAEMLGWCDERMRRIAYGEQYFDPAEMQENSERYQILLATLRERWGSAVADSFAQAWHSASLSDCPALSGWAKLLSAIVGPVSAIDQSAPTVAVADGPAGSTSPQERLARGMLEKAEALLEIGQVEKAVAELEEAYAVAPELTGDSYARALMREGHDAEQRVDLETALAAYQHAARVARSTSLQNELRAIIAEFEHERGEAESVTIADQNLLCPDCGRDIQAGWVNCPYCGASLRQLQDATPSVMPILEPALVKAPASSPVSPTSLELDLSASQAKPLSHAWKRVGIGVLALVAIAIVVMFANMRQPEAVTLPPPPTVMPQPALTVIRPNNADRLQIWGTVVSPSWIESVAISPDNAVLAYGGGGGIWLYDLLQGRELKHLTGHTGQVHSVAFSLDSSRLYSGGVDTGGGRIRAWDWNSGAELWSVSVAPDGWGVHITVSPNGHWLASSAAGEITLWRISDSGLEKSQTWLGEGIPAFSADSRWVGFIGHDAARYGIQLIDIDGNTKSFLSADLPEGGSYTGIIAFAPDSDIVAAGASDNSLLAWQIADRVLVQKLSGHTGLIWSLVFSSDGELLISGSEDRTVRIWRVSDGMHLITLTEHSSKVVSLAFSPDGRALVSGSDDGTALLWGFVGADDITISGVTPLTPVPTEIVLGQIFQNEALGLTMQYQDGWVAQEQTGGVLFASSADVLRLSTAAGPTQMPDDGAILVAGRATSAEMGLPSEVDTQSPEQILDWLVKSNIESSGRVTQTSERQSLELASYPAAVVELSITDSDRTFKWYLSVVVSDDVITLLMGVAPEASWPKYRPVFEAMMASITLHPMTPTPVPSASDRGRIAFTSDQDGNYEIYVMGADGSDPINLTNNPANDRSPAWSLDGNQIAFVSDRDGASEIYVMNSDGSNPSRLTENSLGASNPAWSPNGKQIVFNGWQGGQSVIYVINVDGSDRVELLRGHESAWSPDGQKLAYRVEYKEGNSKIHLADSAGTHSAPITEGVWVDAFPAWSPDGTRIAFSHLDSYASNTISAIYLMDLDGSNLIKIATDPGYSLFGRVAWSPDGTQIAFNSNRSNNSEIYVMNVDGSNPINLTNSPANDTEPAWSP